MATRNVHNKLIYENEKCRLGACSRMCHHRVLGSVRSVCGIWEGLRNNRELLLDLTTLGVRVLSCNV